MTGVERGESMTDGERVAAIERRHELMLLDRLLAERRRPVPPPPVPDDPAVKRQLAGLMSSIAAALEVPAG